MGHGYKGQRRRKKIHFGMYCGVSKLTRSVGYQEQRLQQQNLKK